MRLHGLTCSCACSQPALPGLAKQPSHEEASGAAWTRDQASAATSEAQSKAQRPPPPSRAVQVCSRSPAVVCVGTASLLTPHSSTRGSRHE